MTTRRRYTAKERAHAVGIAAVDGVTQAEIRTGIPKTTIQYWSEKPEFVRLRTKRAEEVAEELWAAMQLGVQRMVELIPQTDDVAKVGVAVGILYDKRALMSGAATSRTESRALADDLDDHEKATLKAAIDEALGK